MEVEIISREAIKPASPTPCHLRIHNLSLLDQFYLHHRQFIPIIHFYSLSISAETKSKSLLLKESLSKTLSHFYPFAGRVKDSFTIDCNDEGVIYVEARVPSAMSIVLEEPRTDLLQKLVPELSVDDAQAMVAIQVNYFACNGMAICASVNHVVADASALASFVKSWAAAACGASVDRIHGAVYDCSSLFPPQDLSNYLKGFDKDQNLLLLEGNLVTKRFSFDGRSIAAIKREIGNHPSRFEALSALIWSALKATTENHDQTFTKASVAVNLRQRMNPPLPQQCIGNAVHVTISEPVMEKKINLTSLAEKIHDSIRKVDDDNIKKLFAGGSYINLVRNQVEEFKKKQMFGFTSWCGFPFYETDFGWGKPIWVGTATSINRVAIFLDSRDGEGIEAWITLTQEDMAKLEQDPGILAYASFKPSIQNSALLI